MPLIISNKHIDEHAEEHFLNKQYQNVDLSISDALETFL
jgi:hypothetical protein